MDLGLFTMPIEIEIGLEGGGSELVRIDNSLAHEKTTGPEIFEQTNGEVDAIVLGVGSSGTVAGLSKYFAEHAPNVDMIICASAGVERVSAISAWRVRACANSSTTRACRPACANHSRTTTRRSAKLWKGPTPSISPNDP